ncbi:hypothetical protein LGH83_14380 [Lichenihabitans sp. PAMC28606]|uniref:hypothetical protein n=1 Tax=Lichenihabitans sp. PAMC28606 TaxID=2880932 RepID=UPI001D0B315F|nr:hypothetical protein [Lichenihabitans sp. PAMC28606]UDL93740.1 hypothetical protein LGH83_14380 [Lichenihabitans sp. PAMC28606]
MMLLLAGPAWAGSLEDKACLLAAAQRLPPIPGLKILGMTVAPAVDAMAVSQIVGSFRTAQAAARSLDETFAILGSSAVSEQIDGFIAAHNDYAARQAIIDAFLPRVSGSGSVTITVDVADLKATYAFMCAYSTADIIIAEPVSLLN